MPSAALRDFAVRWGLLYGPALEILAAGVVLYCFR